MHLLSQNLYIKKKKLYTTNLNRAVKLTTNIKYKYIVYDINCQVYHVGFKILRSLL